MEEEERALGTRGRGNIQPVQEEEEAGYSFEPSAFYNAPSHLARLQPHLCVSKASRRPLESEGHDYLGRPKKQVQLGPNFMPFLEKRKAKGTTPLTDDIADSTEVSWSPTTVESLNIQARVPELATSEVVPDQPLCLHHYVKGAVVPGDNEAVYSLLRDIPKLTTGTTGVVTDSVTCLVQGGQYEEDGHFDVSYVLGQGTSGSVDLCVDRTSNRDFVRKKNKNLDASCLREINVLKCLDHRNIAKFKGVVLRNGNPEIYMENAGKALSQLVSDLTKQGKQLSEPDLALVCWQGLGALHYLHSRGILHLDIKPDNICVMEGPQLELKLTDFGSCKTSQDALCFKGWTPEYMSPEACRMFRDNQLGLPCPFTELDGRTDVFAFGVTVACIRYTKNPLFVLLSQGKTVEQYMQEERRKIIRLMVEKPDLMRALALQISRLTEREKGLLHKLLAGNRDDRSSALDALTYVKDTMLTQTTLDNWGQQPSSQPPSVISQEVASPQPPSPATADAMEVEEEEEEDEEEEEIDIRAVKGHHIPQPMAEVIVVAPESPDPMISLAKKTRQMMVLEDAGDLPGRAAESSISVSRTHPSRGKVAMFCKEGVEQPSPIPPGSHLDAMALAGGAPKSAGIVLSASQRNAFARRSTDFAPSAQTSQIPGSSGKDLLRRHLSKRQRSQPYLADRVVSAPSRSDLPTFSAIL